MRLRNIPGSREVIGESPYVVQEPKRYRGGWSRVFENSHPIHIEVGMGKGQFLMKMARRNPEINYVGIEMYDSVLLRAIQKRESAQEELPNLYFIRMDARELPEVFGPGEVERIYLNFSDPWPKERHAKRRLTSRQFLDRYDQILAPEGEIHFKTDNRPLFEFSLEEVQEAGWQLKGHTFDLHHNLVLCEGNVMTEYEEKFSSQGNPIHKLIAARDREDLNSVKGNP
ncbi:MAG TPA: tRNA (guanosine(46)-N7)-methyltransferase TrmB [Candidatus Egerieimonas intestinavium]|uniref:tRNA (guanine-N(7)-)-methyltransferase n=1 Tax=Candidatus Egerieimonas intestinavium TaxID=2840777 RepID=A0A9D1JGH4_9FIRM|nr:tRNA (guanosine(46)-N7)-methyltransferase TrmB [Candidatus Egerieimonas intestinavium]